MVPFVGRHVLLQPLFRRVTVEVVRNGSSGHASKHVVGVHDGRTKPLLGKNLQKMGYRVIRRDGCWLRVKYMRVYVHVYYVCVYIYIHT